MSDEAGRAFVPGHVTGFFSIHEADDSERAGSRGAGVTLSEGVTVTVEPSEETSIALNGESSVESGRRVLDVLGVTARVTAETDLPLGAGFGVSGALALGTALAANERFDCGRSENELVTVAHVAEVKAGTGLGDVVAQARGGIPIRLEPGAPEYNRLDGVPKRARIEYRSLGELSTAEVLSGSTERISQAGVEALVALVNEPTLKTFMSESRRFAERTGLLTDEVSDVIEDVHDVGGRASMAMLGRTVFALDGGLSNAGYDANACRSHHAGATLLD
jgi:pantoate kinase